MSCKHCGKENCYKHCQSADDGKHVPDPKAITPDQDSGQGRGTDWIIDVSCVNCGTSGSLKIDPADIVFE
jgi:hypothetical protein